MKEGNKEFRHNLAVKLNKLRNADLDIASEHLEKIKKTEEYKGAKEELRSDTQPKRDKRREELEQIEVIKKGIEDIGKEKPQEKSGGLDNSTDMDDKNLKMNEEEIATFAESMVGMSVNARGESQQDTKPTKLNKEKTKAKISPEGQVKIDALTQQMQAFEIKSKQEIDEINKKHETTVASIAEKIKKENDNYKKNVVSLDLKIKNVEDQYKTYCGTIAEKIKKENDKYKEYCDSIDAKIKNTKEDYQVRSLEENKKQEGYSRDSRVRSLEENKKQEGYSRDSHVRNLEDNKKQEGYSRDSHVRNLEENKRQEGFSFDQKIKTAKDIATRTAIEFQRKIAQAKIDGNPENLESVGPLEDGLRNKINELISGAKSEEDKDVYQGFVSSINNLKNLLRDNKLKFHKDTGYSPTIENMNKYSNLWKEVSETYSSNNILKGVLKNIDDPKKANKYFGHLRQINKMTPVQTREILRAFGFGADKQIRDIYEAYNKQKSFFQSSAKQGKKHEFTMDSKVAGVSLLAFNYEGKREDTDSVSFFMNQKFIKELFESSKIEQKS